MEFLDLFRAGRRLAPLLLAALFLTGCAALSPANPEDLVRQRAQARWDALIAGDWASAYRYMAPSYRELVEEKRYANQFGAGASWVAAEVVKVTCTEDRCTVRMRVEYRVALRPGQSGENYFNETWIREQGHWWMFQRV